MLCSPVAVVVYFVCAVSPCWSRQILFTIVFLRSLLPLDRFDLKWEKKIHTHTQNVLTSNRNNNNKTTHQRIVRTDWVSECARVTKQYICIATMAYGECTCIMCASASQRESALSRASQEVLFFCFDSIRLLCIVVVARTHIRAYWKYFKFWFLILFLSFLLWTFCLVHSEWLFVDDFVSLFICWFFCYVFVLLLLLSSFVYGVAVWLLSCNEKNEWKNHI